LRIPVHLTNNVHLCTTLMEESVRIQLQNWIEEMFR